jgi:hypothetical protein
MENKRNFFCKNCVKKKKADKGKETVHLHTESGRRRKR